MTANDQIDSIIVKLRKLQRFVIKNPEYENCSCINDDLMLLDEEIDGIVDSHYTP